MQNQNSVKVSTKKQRYAANNKRSVGNQYEELACSYLMKQGLKIVKRNFRVRQGEIDIVAKDGNTLVFVEVKYRKNTKTGYPEEAVSFKKQQQICKIAMFYYSFYHIYADTPCRFDVVAVCHNSVRWIKNAFPFCL